MTFMDFNSKVDKTEFNETVDSLQTELDGKASKIHTHSDKVNVSDYNTKISELTSSVNSKAASNHNHDSNYMAKNTPTFSGVLKSQNLEGNQQVVNCTSTNILVGNPDKQLQLESNNTPIVYTSTGSFHMIHNGWNDVMIRRGNIYGNDSWNIKQAGIYKVQNCEGEGKPEGQYLYGVLVVYNSEIAGEERTSQIYHSHHGVIVSRMYNSGWTEWSHVSIKGSSVDGFNPDSKMNVSDVWQFSGQDLKCRNKRCVVGSESENLLHLNYGNDFANGVNVWGKISSSALSTGTAGLGQTTITAGQRALSINGSNCYISFSPNGDGNQKSWIGHQNQSGIWTSLLNIRNDNDAVWIYGTQGVKLYGGNTHFDGNDLGTVRNINMSGEIYRGYSLSETRTTSTQNNVSDLEVNDFFKNLNFNVKEEIQPLSDNEKRNFNQIMSLDLDLSNVKETELMNLISKEQEEEHGGGTAINLYSLLVLSMKQIQNLQNQIEELKASK